MDDLRYMAWLGERALWFMGWFWPATLFCLGFLALAALKTFRRDRRPFPKRALLPALGIPTLLAWGTIFEGRHGYDGALSLFFYIQIAASIFLVARMKGSRLFTAAIDLSILWCSLCCLVVAVMSVTDWWGS